jgi:YVTN family beta-propeller protein
LAKKTRSTRVADSSRTSRGRVSVVSALLFLCAARLTAAGPFAYVADGGFGTVSVIDIETNAVIATISLPAGTQPGQLAVSPDGTRVYVSTGNALAVIDTATNSVVVPSIPVGLGTRSVAISPDGRFAYVAVQFEGRVTIVDTTTNAVVATVNTGGQPTGLKMTPDGSRVYVANSLSGTVSVIDAITETIIATIPVEYNPQDLEMSPDGTRVYVSNFSAASVSVIDTGSNMVVATISVGFVPSGMDTTPTGGRLYVVDNGSVAVIDTATNTLSGRVTLPPFHTSRDVAIAPDGTRGYVTINTPPRVLVFETASNTVVGDPILIENGIPEGIAITLARDRIAVTLDIKPRDITNSVNPRSSGVIPVAILTTGAFDATAVDPLTVRFGQQGTPEAHGRGHLEDVNGDGRLDLVLHFRTDKSGIKCGDGNAKLTGATVTGSLIEGQDLLLTVGCR